MDAARLPPPAAVPAPGNGAPANGAPIGGRFTVAGNAVATPTGEEFAAKDTQGGANVTLKLVPDAVLPTAAMSDRALRELKQLGKVTSERIVHVVDQGRAPDGRVYVATEKLDGAQSLEAMVARSGPLPIERARDIVLQVGEALTEAQKVGVIHRDVAPRNIFVGPGDRVKLGDFGLAEPVSDTVFGAPAFLSPEQAEGKPVDQRSNIYSLGAVFYFALTGEPPFKGETKLLLQQHLEANPPPPSSKRHGLPAEIDRVVLKALEKSGGRRHLTLRQLLTELAAPGGTAPGIDTSARTVMAEAPAHVPAAAHAPTPGHPIAKTVMGIASPIAAMGPGTASAGANARTVMAEAPSAPVMTPPPSVATPSAPAHVTPPVVQEAPRAPAPVAPAPVAPKAPTPTPAFVPAAAAAATSSAAGKKGFRETAWFKKGEIEEEMAKAQAAFTSEDPLAPTGKTGTHAIVDESQVDVSAQDRARLSLKTGATQAMAAVKLPPSGGLPGERMNESEMLAEIDNSRKWLFIAGAVVAVLVIGLVIYFATHHGSPKAEAPPPDKPVAVAVSPPTPPPKAPAPAAAPSPTAPAPSPPTTSAPAAAPNGPQGLIAQAATAAQKEDYAAAVDKLEQASQSGADPHEVKRVAGTLEKGLAVRAKSHKKKDRAMDLALLSRVKKISRKR